MKNIVNILTILIISVFCSTNSEILIMVPVFNRPDFIEIQYKTFKKFLKDKDYKIIMFNDANNDSMEQKIKEVCATYGITCIRVPQTVHDVKHHLRKDSEASFRHGEVMQFAFENYGFKHNDVVMLIDSDVFLIHEFSIREYLGDNDMFGIFQNCLVPQLCFLNMPKLDNPQSLNFRAGHAPWNENNLHDAGCFTDKYIVSHPKLKLKKLNPIWGLFRKYPISLNLDDDKDMTPQLTERGYTELEINLIESIFKVCKDSAKTDPNSIAKISFDIDIGFYETNIFLDYWHGSAWHNPSNKTLAIKDKLIKDFISSILK